jgi:hypothetical protein
MSKAPPGVTIPVLGLVVASWLGLGCESSQPPVQPDHGGDPGGDPPQVDFTDPEALLGAYALRLTHGDSDNLLPLLAADFQYCVRKGDEALIPWLEGSCWDRTVESDIVRRMAHPDSFGMPPTPRLLGIALRTESLEAVGDEIRVRSRVPVLTFGYRDPGMNRWITHFDIVLVRDSQGTLRVREIREVASSSSRSWSLFKSTFHPGSDAG